MATKSYGRMTASGIVCGSRGRLAGFYVASTSSGTITLYDNTSAAAPQISGTITPAAGLFHPYPVDFQTGLYATISGTIDVTFLLE